MLKLAVLMSVYRKDQPENVGVALRSVFDQELGGLAEVRVYLGVDGEIPEPLEHVLERYSERLHRVSRSEKNQGLGATLNRLLKLLQDESYIFRMDADDICLPDRFRRQLNYMQSNPECGVLGGAIIEFEEDGRFSDRIIKYPQSFPEPVKALAKRSPVAHPAVCIRRDVFDAVGGYPPLKTNEDIGLWWRCVHLGVQFNNLADPVLRYRINSEFFSRRSTSKSYEEFKVYMSGIYRSVGLSPYFIFPCLRLLFRMLPGFLVRYVYSLRGIRAGLP